MFIRYSYIPAIKTTGSECKAYENLPSLVKDNLLPMFELTKSRTSANNSLGDVRKNLEKIKSMTEGRPFVLDITKEFGLDNPELNSFSNIEDGYSNWCNFLNDEVVNKFSLVAPCIQVNLTSSLSFDEWKAALGKQISFLEEKFNFVCLRITSDLGAEFIKYLLEDVVNLMKTPYAHLFILDLKLLTPTNYANKLGDVTEVLESLKTTPISFRNIAIMSSSFPQSTTPDEGAGTVELREVKLFKEVQRLFSTAHLNIVYADYCSIHPVRYDTGGGGFTPRIDYPLDEVVSFYKQRFKKGKTKIREISEAYQNCALKIVEKHFGKDNLKTSNVWGEEEIRIAANEKPRGNSPSYWIAVRANIHIVRQYERLWLDLI